MNLQGKKTYIAGACILAVAVVGKYFDVIDGQTAATLIAVALTSMGLRSGIKKVERIL